MFYKNYKTFALNTFGMISLFCLPRVCHRSCRHLLWHNWDRNASGRDKECSSSSFLCIILEPGHIYWSQWWWLTICQRHWLVSSTPSPPWSGCIRWLKWACNVYNNCYRYVRIMMLGSYIIICFKVQTKELCLSGNKMRHFLYIHKTSIVNNRLYCLIYNN